MSREVLLALLGAAVMLNLAVLGVVWIGFERGAARRRTPRTRPVLVEGPRESSAPADPADPPATEAVADLVPVSAPVSATSAAVDAPAVPAAVTWSAVAVAAQPSNPVPDAVARNRRRANRRGRGRPSRFVLPPLGEDNGSSERAIRAFISPDSGPDLAAGQATDAVTTPPSGQPAHRRRHRSRRSPGARGMRTTLVMALDGYVELETAIGAEQAARLAGAFGEALWRSGRVGDEVRELGAGRVLVILDCDAAGAGAFAERAALAVRPWLGALAVPLGVAVSREAQEPASASG